MEKVILGQRLRLLRQQKGYTLQSLAQKAGIGNVYLSEIERGLKMPSLNSFIGIVEALEVSADSILHVEPFSDKDRVYDEITRKMQYLTPQQRKAAAAILDAYLRNL